MFLSYFFLITSITFYFFIIYQFFATRRSLSRKYYTYSEELFAGLKDKNKARAYTIFLTTRRVLLCMILICFQDINFIVRVVSFGSIQIFYLIYLILIRPFTEITNNIVEIINESILTILVLLLLYYNKSNRWNFTIEQVFINLILSCSALVCLVLIMSLTFSIIYNK